MENKAEVRIIIATRMARVDDSRQRLSARSVRLDGRELSEGFLIRSQMELPSIHHVMACSCRSLSRAHHRTARAHIVESSSSTYEQNNGNQAGG